MALALATRLAMNDGRGDPVVGLGVYAIPPGRPTREAVQAALDAGYRHIDTARLYGNEEDVGAAVRASGVPREEVFITTKVWNADHGYEAALRAGEASLRRLGIGYIDLYLIHWPVPKLRGETWRALVRLREDGVCRSIGVSNYTIPHLEELLATSDVVPAVNQVEFSPFLYQQGLLEFCRSRGILVEAYSPLTKGQRLGDPVLGSVARAHGRTPAQVLLRWGLQRGLVVLPKSARPARIRENAALFDFELPPADLARLDALSEAYRTSWNPDGAP